MDFAPLAAMSTLIIAIINLVKYVRAKDTNGIVTTLAVWGAGVVVTFLAANADVSEGINVTDAETLGSLNNWSLVFVGLTIAAMGQFAVQVKKAIDQSDSDTKPDLVGGA